MFFRGKTFFLNIMSLRYAKFQMTNERERTQSHYSISVVTIEILILGLHFFVCIAKAYEKGGRHFCALFSTLKVSFTDNRSYLLRLSQLNVRNKICSNSFSRRYSAVKYVIHLTIICLKFYIHKLITRDG